MKHPYYAAGIQNTPTQIRASQAALRRWAGMLLCWCLALSVQAATWYVKPNGSDGNTGASWEQAFRTLQQALALATAGDEIWVAAGAYYPDEGPGQTNNDRSSTFQLRNGVGVFGGFAGTETLRTQRNWVSNVTILSGNIDQSGDNSGNAYSVTTGSATDATAVLDGFTVKDGNSDDSGGGMLIGFGSPTVRNCTFTANSAVNGGGMSNEHAPFDKNQAERDLRMNKVRQKVSGGFRSLQVGKEFMDVRFFIATANKQGADPIEELVHFSRQATMLTCGSLGTLNSYNSSSQSSTL